MRALRRLLGHPRLLPLTALLLRARTVRPATGFALRELADVHDVRLYRLATSGLRVAIRHRSADPVTLGEVFHEWDYLPPPALEDRLRGARRIVDLGANIGLFGAFAAARWPEARIVAYEPDPDNLAVHRRTLAANGLGGRWSLVPAAAGVRGGRLAFVTGQASLSHALGDGEGDGGPASTSVPVNDVLPEIAGADLLKMDIEGGEWEILGDPRFAASPPRTVVLEYHPHLCPEPDAASAAQAALEAAGLSVHVAKRLPGGHGLLWAWRP